MSHTPGRSCDDMRDREIDISPTLALARAHLPSAGSQSPSAAPCCVPRHPPPPAPSPAPHRASFALPRSPRPHLPAPSHRPGRCHRQHECPASCCRQRRHCAGNGRRRRACTAPRGSRGRSPPSLPPASSSPPPRQLPALAAAPPAGWRHRCGCCRGCCLPARTAAAARRSLHRTGTPLPPAPPTPVRTPRPGARSHLTPHRRLLR